MSNTLKTDTSKIFHITPYEQLFSVLNIGVKDSKTGVDYSASSFKRPKYLNVKAGDLSLKGKFHFCLLDKINGKDLSLNEFFNNDRDKIIVVDNPISTTKYTEMFENQINYNDEEDDIDANRYPDNNEMVVFFSQNLLGSSTDGEHNALEEGYIPNMVPLHFITGCGYRTLAINVSTLKFEWKDNTSEIVPPSYFDGMGIQLLSKAQRTFKSYFDDSAFLKSNQDYVYYSTYKNYKKIDPSYLNSFSKIIDSGASASLHLYADEFSKAIYDTYNTFMCTHSKDSSQMNVAGGYQMLVGNLYFNIGEYLNTIINNDIKFPVEDRLITYNRDERSYGYIGDKRRVSKHLKEIDEMIYKGMLSNRNFRGYRDDNYYYLDKLRQGAIIFQEIEKNFDFHSEGYEKSKEELERFLQTFGGFTGFAIVNFEGLIDDEVAHGLGVDGIFTSSNHKEKPEFIALPFFFLQYLMYNNMLSTLNIRFLAIFSKRQTITPTGPDKKTYMTQVVEKLRFRTMNEISNFAMKPMIALYERMYSVLYVDMLNSYLRKRLSIGGHPIQFNLFCNHNAKEIAMFAPKDTFSNCVTMIKGVLNELHCQEYFVVFPTEEGSRDLRHPNPFEFLKDGDIETQNGSLIIKDDVLAKRINDLEEKINSSFNRNLMIDIYDYDKEDYTKVKFKAEQATSQSS